MNKFHDTDQLIPCLLRLKVILNISFSLFYNSIFDISLTRVIMEAIFTDVSGLWIGVVSIEM